MNRKEIHFVVERNGTITSTIKGVKGRACSDIAEAIKSLGSVLKQGRTEEYFSHAQSQTKVQIKPE
jgi:hypothetical protein